MRKIYTTILFAILFSQVATAQTTVTFTSDKDNSIFSQSGTLSNGTGDIFTGVTNTGSSIHRGLVHFTLSGIPSNAVVTSVTVKLNVTKFHGASHTIELHKVSNAWGEGTSNSTGGGAAATTNDATWTHRLFPSTTWTSAGGDFSGTVSSSTSVTTTGSITFSSASQLVSDVQSWVTTPSSNNGWLIKNTNEATAGNSVSFASKEFSIATSRPQLTVTYNVVAPITLKNFWGSLQKDDVMLKWQTATESKTDFFDIEHSTNSKEFTSIGKVAAAGTSNDTRSYSFVHSNVGSGKHYYRLAQHDLDGTIHYSSIIMISSKSGLQVQLTPNPVEKTLTVTSSAAINGSSFLLISATGQIVRSGTFNIQQIDVSTLRTGIYQLIIQTKEGEVLRNQFIKH